MEVVSVREPLSSTSTQIEQPDLVQELPPPPEPFPVQILDELDQSDALKDVIQILPIIQRDCVHCLSSLLPADDPSGRTLYNERLATALTDLLEATIDLEALTPGHSLSGPSTASMPDTSTDFRAQLSQGLINLHATAMSRPLPTFDSRHDPSVGMVHEALVWGRVESLSHAVIQLLENHDSSPEQLEEDDPVEARSPFADQDSSVADVRTPYQDALDPPVYSAHEYEAHNALPGYDEHGFSDELPFLDEKPPEPLSSALTSTGATRGPRVEEKTMQDLNSVYDALDRMHDVAPRLEGQRVSMRPPLSEDSKRQAEIRQNREKMKEMERIWDLIERTHRGRRGERQRADMWADFDSVPGSSSKRRDQFYDDLVSKGEGGRLTDQESPLRDVDRDLARARDLRDKDAFVKGMMEQTSDTRLRNQDSIPPMRRLAKKKEMLLDNISRRFRDGDTLSPKARTAEPWLHDPTEVVSVQDFLRTAPAPAPTRPQRQGRNRSLSLPLSDESKSVYGFKQRVLGMVRKNSGGVGVQSASEDVPLSGLTYIAEYQENLRSVHLLVLGLPHSVEDGSVTPWTVDNVSEASGAESTSHAFIWTKDHPFPTAHLLLPTPVQPGQSIPLVSSEGHFEARLQAGRSSAPSHPSSHFAPIEHALSASELRDSQTSALDCSSCGIKLVDLSTVVAREAERSGTGFKNLPSEHWAEMLEMWMCHSDPSFTSRLAAKTKDGFWPTEHNILVGGSYLLIHPVSLVTKLPSTKIEKDLPANGWSPLQCPCGETIGKQYQAPGKPGNGTLRVNKWSISFPGHDGPVHWPLSVFVVSDMLELAQAHATYRFIIVDEETSESRLAIWLFTPSLRVSFGRGDPTSTASSPLRPEFDSGTSNPVDSAAEEASQAFRAAKIMYQVLDVQSGMTEDSLPGFGPGGQIERLTYPLGVTRGLASQLRDSTKLYPAPLRRMGAFDVGFLQRA